MITRFHIRLKGEHPLIFIRNDEFFNLLLFERLVDDTGAYATESKATLSYLP